MECDSERPIDCLYCPEIGSCEVKLEAPVSCTEPDTDHDQRNDEAAAKWGAQVDAAVDTARTYAVKYQAADDPDARRVTEYTVDKLPEFWRAVVGCSGFTSCVLVCELERWDVTVLGD